jgi:hypothetical protein
VRTAAHPRHPGVAQRSVPHPEAGHHLDYGRLHEEKIFSLFQPHTEWIVKGKAGVPMELGLQVHVMEHQHQFLQ